MEAASRSTTRRQGLVGAGATVAAFSVLVSLLSAVPDARAAKLGGPYFVDEAEIGKAGSCEVESWASSARNGDHIYVLSPACVVRLGAPVEVGTNLVNHRADGVGDSTASLTAKTVPIPLNMPLSYDFSETLRLNVNAGAQYNADPSVLLATGGVGVAWNFVDHWSLISEVFALVGPGLTNPRFQTGLRYSPTTDVDCDLIYGRNLLGEGANWITVALTVRIGDD